MALILFFFFFFLFNDARTKCETQYYDVDIETAVILGLTRSGAIVFLYPNPNSCFPKVHVMVPAVRPARIYISAVLGYPDIQRLAQFGNFEQALLAIRMLC
jgi:hypothetical protein